MTYTIRTDGPVPVPAVSVRPQRVTAVLSVEPTPTVTCGPAGIGRSQSGRSLHQNETFRTSHGPDDEVSYLNPLMLFQFTG